MSGAISYLGIFDDDRKYAILCRWVNKHIGNQNLRKKNPPPIDKISKHTDRSASLHQHIEIIPHIILFN